MDKMNRMKELVQTLTEASKVYYAQDREIMSNFEYDKLYDELVALEAETGITLSDSPTVKVGYEAVDELPKERHASPMLSLGKTKERAELVEWLGGKEGLLSWKLDGLTVVLTYRDGELQKAVTRGNGEIGEVITPNAKVFSGVPLRIGYKGELVLRGEAVISYSDFEKINASIDNPEDKYKNPRNLCSGSVRQLNSEITAKRHVRFIAFSLVSAEDTPGVNHDFGNSAQEKFNFLESQGFFVVPYRIVNPDTILDGIAAFAEDIKTYEIPSDGLVLTYEDIAYGQSLGSTAKYPRHSIAFKWADELAETTLREIEWSASRTGLINPVAIFDPVELEGTTVSRASVHNVSIVKELALGIGDRITVYKANMIIPQIAENLTKSGTLEIPKVCPVCGGETTIRQMNDTMSLYCQNEECPAKQIKSFAQFVSRDAMNVDGLSEATLEKFIDLGFIKEYADLFRLERFREEIISLDGFGVKSYDKLMAAIDTARHTTLPRLLFSLGIVGIGAANAKLLCKAFGQDLGAMRNASRAEFAEIDKIGEVLADSLYVYFHDEKKMRELDELLALLELPAVDEIQTQQDLSLDGKIFVITGSLNHFENRKQLQELIEAKGGKVTGSVTGKTTCLINNDSTSGSSKNKTAKSLGVEILTEDEFLGLHFPDFKIS